MISLSSQIVEVDENITGNLWSVSDINELAKIIALIALGQAEHAAEIIQSIEKTVPVLSRAEFYNEAREQLKIRNDNDEKKDTSPYHRDGFLFECISWIISQQDANEDTYMKDPHISATTQGLDGLIIQMDSIEQMVVHTTICEDKCTARPRDKFRDEVIPTFKEHHQNKRGRDLLSNAIALIKQSGLKGRKATLAADKVYDKNYRTYRAALTVSDDICTAEARIKLFKGYDGLTEISKTQRIGSTFLVSGNLRDWFQELANHVIEKLNEFEEEESENV